MRIDVEIPEAAVRGQHGVYVAFNEAGEVLYIGRTSDLYRRMMGHRSQSPWFRQMRVLEFTPCDGVSEARATEKSMIATFRPASNINDYCEQQRSSRQRLPDWTVAKLVALYEACVDTPRTPAVRERLDNYILALRGAGWTLAAIAEGLGMSREAVRLRQNRATRADSSPGVPAPPTKVKPPKKVRPSIAPAKLQELRELQVLARRVNGPTPLDSPLRAASERYTELLAEQYLAGVSIYRIAKQMGVTHLAIKARLARHGYVEPIKGLPSNTPYGERVHRSVSGERSSHCKDGHELSGDNLRLVNGDPAVRQCRACSRRRSNEYAARKRQDGAA